MAAKNLNLKVGSDAIAAQLDSKIGKDELYGRVEQIVERDGKRLEKGWLLPDGVVFRKAQVSMAPVDPDGSPEASPEVYSAGQKLELRPSSFDDMESFQPVPLEILARFVTTDVYPLMVPQLKLGLYKGNFNYRKSARARDALILVREDAAFLLVGQCKACPMVERAVAYQFFDAASSMEEAADPLDFSMM